VSAPILRHSDPRITTEVYGHLSPEYLGAEVDRLRFGPAQEPESTTSAESAAVPMAVNFSPFGPPVVHDTENGSEDPSPTPDEHPKHFEFSTARPEGIEPPTFGFEVGALSPLGMRLLSGQVTQG